MTPLQVPLTVESGTLSENLDASGLWEERVEWKPTLIYHDHMTGERVYSQEEWRVCSRLGKV